MKIMIIGGHGRIALLAAPPLVKGGHHVTSVVRNAEHVADVEATGATAVVADLEAMDGPATRELLAGSDAVIWLAGAGGGDPARTVAVDRDAAIRTIDAAAAEGVDRFVMVSYVRSGRDNVSKDNPFHHYAEAKAAADSHLRQTRLNWTILGPTHLTDEGPTSRIECGDHVTQGKTSRANVAGVVAQAVGRRDLAGATINFRDGRISSWEALDSAARRAAQHRGAPHRKGQR